MRSRLLGQLKICVNSSKKFGVDQSNYDSNFIYHWKILENNFRGNIAEYNNQIEVNWSNSPLGIYTIEVTKSSLCGKATEELVIELIDKPKVDIIPIHYLCPNINSMILSAPIGFDSYAWKDNSGKIISEKNEVEVSSEGFYLLEVFSGDCKGVAETKVIAVIFPDFKINTTVENSMIIVKEGGNTEVLYQLLSEDRKLIKDWQSSNIFTDLSKGKYIVQIKSVNGNCLSNMNAEMFVIPNVITPNQDGYNDVWDLSQVLKNYPNATIEIYDRFGKKLKIISKSDEFKWDGKIGGKPLPTDSYWFIINYDGHQTKSGSLLIKNK